MKYYFVIATVLAVCSWVASDSNYSNIFAELGKQCQPRFGATTADYKLLAIYKRVYREVQKKLIHCVYQKLNIICGDFLDDIAYFSMAYTRFYDGDSLKFNDAPDKIQECYNAGKKFDGEDGLNVSWAMYDCLRMQWNQDKRTAISNERAGRYGRQVSYA